jgi:hypothetical protein
MVYQADHFRSLGPCRGPSILELLILHSCQDYSWKLADFGLTSDGLLNRIHLKHVGVYNNKGYGMHSILLQRKKAFSVNWAMLDYSRWTGNIFLGHVRRPPFRIWRAICQRYIACRRRALLRNSLTSLLGDVRFQISREEPVDFANPSQVWGDEPSYPSSGRVRDHDKGLPYPLSAKPRGPQEAFELRRR